MLTWIVIGAVALLLGLALLRLGGDESAVRRLQRSEYRSLVKYLWFQ